MEAALNGHRAPLSPEELTRRVVALTVAETAAPKPASFAALAHDLTAASDPPPSPEDERCERDHDALPRLLQNGAPVDRWVITDDGFRRWRPIIGRFVVTALPGGARLIEIGRGNTLRLDAEQAAHLARLLLLPTGGAA